MRIATWNVNSIRARLDRLVAWLDRSDVDVIALQETKVPDAGFPLQVLAEHGYSVASHGISQWNGVAVLSRVGIEDVEIGWPGMPGFGDPVAPEARAIAATCGGVRMVSLYVPNGRSVGDPHYDYKLAWLASLREHAAARLAADPQLRMALCGDFNIAPTDEDVWSVEYYKDSTHVTPPERAAFAALVDAGYADMVRPYAPGPETYTYWDYTQLAFPKRRGMRIDFLLGSPALAAATTGALIDRQERKGKGASDHAPVIVDLDLTADIVAPAPIPAAPDPEPAAEGQPGLWA
ncbi:exodeoxyribonuclease III [Nakamurella sp. YIM 132087]|uniref:Exodeoxyribonuclease III n=1 Tax=Nakamurella alba TaxID=2665158 RepID=A0A7K1FR83_9ACTN|nr:exodeoxyribonuclease III [Nakamurella alba]MTD16662.1 exodeoxyribonuclease III [Nakamurella alba]